MRRLPPLVLALVLGLLAALAVACGDDGDDDRGLLPQSRAAAIQEELDTIAERVENGRCLQLVPAFQRLDRAIAELPRSTDRDLRRRLAEGADNLQEIAPDECRDNRPERPQTTETEPETTPETVPETVETEPPPVETEPTPPPTQTTPPQTTPPTPPPVPEDPTGGEPAPEEFTPPGQAKKGKD